MKAKMMQLYVNRIAHIKSSDKNIYVIKHIFSGGSFKIDGSVEKPY